MGMNYRKKRFSMGVAIVGAVVAFLPLLVLAGIILWFGLFLIGDALFRNWEPPFNAIVSVMAATAVILAYIPSPGLSAIAMEDGTVRWTALRRVWLLLDGPALASMPRVRHAGAGAGFRLSRRRGGRWIRPGRFPKR